MNEDVKSENLRIHSRADELIACLEGEIAKRDEELAAFRVAVENCEVFRARIVELEGALLDANARLNGPPVSEAKAQGVTDEQAAFEAAVAAVNERGWSTSTDLARQIWDAARIDVADCPPSYRGGKE